jgi:DNA-dependent RNA polymerase auxiliary subunit epsilon
MLKFLVRFNTHANADWSDRPRSAYLVVEADTSDDAREVVRAKEKHGVRWIGSVHQAEVYQRATGQF